MLIPKTFTLLVAQLIGSTFCTYLSNGQYLATLASIQSLEILFYGANESLHYYNKVIAKLKLESHPSVLKFCPWESYLLVGESNNIYSSNKEKKNKLSLYKISFEIEAFKPLIILYDQDIITSISFSPFYKDNYRLFSTCSNDSSTIVYGINSIKIQKSSNHCQSIVLIQSIPFKP